MAEPSQHGVRPTGRVAQLVEQGLTSRPERWFESTLVPLSFEQHDFCAFSGVQTGRTTSLSSHPPPNEFLEQLFNATSAGCSPQPEVNNNSAQEQQKQYSNGYPSSGNSQWHDLSWASDGNLEPTLSLGDSLITTATAAGYGYAPQDLLAYDHTTDFEDMPDLYTREECIDFSQVISLSSEASPTTVSTSDVHSMGIRRLLADEELPGQSPHLEPGALPFLTSSNVSSYRDTNQGYDLPTLHEESQHSTIYKYKCEKGCAPPSCTDADAAFLMLERTTIAGTWHKNPVSLNYRLIFVSAPWPERATQNGIYNT
ncbi:hypothetical protein H9L39_18797 [Fusarium oxysporum f. sp. albedinis]|nr:hypothetical protein H9L39_18797 [Fusarium oxysporum f. sp. albedinis]